MTDNPLKNKIKELEFELLEKNDETSLYLDKIDSLEDEILKLEDAISDKEAKSEITDVSFLKMQAADLEKKNRELKNKIGYLRLENVKLKQKLENANKPPPKSSVIRIVQPRHPSNASVIKDIIYIENAIKKPQINKEEIKKRLKHLMDIAWKKP